ncbi:MAG TPA: enoyl-CoA hydratase/isomerase family protein, partial [Enhygromyxa sp.]|nr:enoyl-CoA hydratase/isomerase family protein [Enhygromyxa sp.]
QVERDGELAILRMQAGKANAMNPAMVQRLAELCDELASSDARALVITGDGRSFSAGLSLPQLIDLDRATMRGFMTDFKSAMLQVFSLPMPVVAAIDGHAIAGGCVLACQCDVRLAADRPLKIGVNEVQLGIGLPAVVIETLRLMLPSSSLVPVALAGGLFEAREALAVGLVDEVVAPEQLLGRACERARELAAIPTAAYAQVKLAWRRPAIEAIESSHEALGEQWLDTWYSTEAQRRLRAIVDRLHAKASS